MLPNALVLTEKQGRRPHGNPENPGKMHHGAEAPKVVKFSKSEARWNYGVWIGSFDAPDEHLIDSSLAVVKPRAVTAPSDGQ